MAPPAPRAAAACTAGRTPRARQGEQHAVGRFRKVGDAPVAGPPVQLLPGVFRVHRPDRPGEVPEVGGAPRAEGGRIGRNADQGDAPRRQHAPQRGGVAERFGRGRCAAWLLLLQSFLPVPRAGPHFLLAASAPQWAARETEPIPRTAPPQPSKPAARRAVRSGQRIRMKFAAALARAINARISGSSCPPSAMSASIGQKNSCACATCPCMKHS